MTAQIMDLTVRRSVTVDVPQRKAFSVFSAGFDTWWPREHHIGKAPMQAAVMEQKLGGRWSERGTDGSECDWGKVLAWDPPNRFVVSWHLNGAFVYDPDPAHASEVEVRFISETPHRTRVELVHRNIERHGETAEALSKGISAEGGWATLLGMFAKVAME